MRRPCGDCGSYHGRSPCPVRELVLRQEPYGLSPPRPEPRPLSHPAQRDVDDRTAFLIRPRRLV